MAACGGSKTPTQTQPGPTSTGAGALKAEAASASTGDIPDNQVFLTYANRAGAYTIKYPEGWARSGSGTTVTFKDKNNIVRVVVTKGSPPSLAQVRQQVAALRGVKITTPSTQVTVNGKPAIRVVYETESAKSPVTGKTVTLGVDRYYLWNGTKVAIVDLGTPVAPVLVDNVDAYRLIAQSFRWR